MEYKLNRRGWFIFFAHVDTIEMGLIHSNGLTDSEIIKFTSDCLTHEHIHRAIFKLFNNWDLCAMFDFIEHNFRMHPLTRKKQLTLYNEHMNRERGKRLTYVDYINRFGAEALFEHYHITDYDFNIASDICNKRRW